MFIEYLRKLLTSFVVKQNHFKTILIEITENTVV